MLQSQAWVADLTASLRIPFSLGAQGLEWGETPTWIDPLALVYAFDATEAGGEIRFVQHGGAPVAVHIEQPLAIDYDAFRSGSRDFQVVVDPDRAGLQRGRWRRCMR